MENLEKRLVISKEDLESYSVASLGNLKIVNDTDPDKIVCLLRGGYPPTRVVKGLAEEYLGKSPEVYDIPTSDFLKNKKQLVYALAEQTVHFAHNSGGRARIFTVDAAITGSSSRQFLSEFAKAFKRAVERDETGEGVTLDYVFSRFWDKSESRFSKKKIRPVLNNQKVEKKDGTVSYLNFHNYDFGVRSLVCEDFPALLGIDYPIHLSEEENNGIRGQKSEYAVRVSDKSPLVVVDGGHHSFYKPHGDQTTADLFVSLALDYCRDQMKKIQAIDDRENLNTFEYNPDLVKFCKSLKR